MNIATISYNDSEATYGTIGGIVGSNDGGTVSNCSNQGEVNGYATQVGGIVGSNDGIITNCNNLGIINTLTDSLYGSYGAGGISGCNFGTILDSTNNSNIEIEFDVGGIVGSNSGGTVKNCKNNKRIESTSNLGGIAGYSEYDSKIQFCQNNGEIRGSRSGQGGIVGRVGAAMIEGCQNNGEIISNSTSNSTFNYIGGIAGTFSNGSKDGIIKNCFNEAGITVNAADEGMIVGGIIGLANYSSSYETTKNIIGCYNTGNIVINSSTGYTEGIAGGIIGEVCSAQGKTTIKDCYNLGNIDGVGPTAGGIIGQTLTTNGHSLADSIDIINCYNKGNVDCYTQNKYWAVSVGGIVGDNRSYFSEEAIITIFNCYNQGTISGEASLEDDAVCYVGGITGHNYVEEGSTGKICNTYNTGIISVKGRTNEYAGAIYGRNIGDVFNSYYLDTSISNETEINNGTSNIEKNTAEFMKSNEFVTKLNNNTEDWKMDSENINSGYPILSKTLEVNKIEMNTSPTKITYIQNIENLDLTGGIITVTYNDGSTSTVNLTNENVTVTGFNNTTVGTNTLTVEYGGKTTTFDIQIISKQITEIEVTTNPTKITYIQNYERLDLTNGVITVMYNDGSTSTINLTNENVTVTGFDNTQIGTNTLTVEYGGKITTFDIQIISKQIAEIEVTTNPTKTTYIQNYETLDLTNGIITVTYNDGSTSTVNLTNENVEVRGFNNTTVGTNTLTVEYEGKTTTFNIEIISKQITKIEVTTNPTKTTYIQNYETLDLTNGIITVTYDDGSTSTVNLTNEKVKVTGFNNTTVGTNTLTVEYEGKTTTFNIEIISKQITKIEVTTNLTKTIYIQNYEELDLTGGILTVTYNDESTDSISLTNEKVRVTGFNNTTVGTNTLAVEYEGKTTTFDIEIISKQAIGIQVTTNPNQTTYIQNQEKLDLTGGIVTITYNDGSTETISLTNENVKVIGFDNTKAGEITLTVEYGGNKTSFDIKIISENENGSDNKEDDKVDDTLAEGVLPNAGGKNIIFIVITLIIIISVIFNKKYKKYKDI